MINTPLKLRSTWLRPDILYFLLCIPVVLQPQSIDTSDFSNRISSKSSPIDLQMYFCEHNVSISSKLQMATIVSESMSL